MSRFLPIPITINLRIRDQPLCNGIDRFGHVGRHVLQPSCRFQLQFKGNVDLRGRELPPMINGVSRLR